MLIITLPVAFLIGAMLGWGRAQRRLYRRPGSNFSGDSVPSEELPSRLLARRRRKRWLMAGEFGFYAALIDVLAFEVLMRFV